MSCSTDKDLCSKFHITSCVLECKHFVYLFVGVCRCLMLVSVGVCKCLM